MAQILVPDTDRTPGSWTSSPLWSKVDDDSTVNPSGDGTTIQSADNTSPDTAELGLSSGTDPGVSTGHVLRVRWNKSGSGGHTIDGVLQLWESDPISDQQRASLSVTNIGSTEVESTYTLSGAEADAITDYSMLYVRVIRQGDTGGNPNGRRSLVVDLIELEIPDAGGSPVNVDAVSAGLASSAQPADIGLGALDTQASPVLMSMAAQTAEVSLAALGISAAAAGLGLIPQPATVGLGALDVPAQPATAGLVAQPATVSIQGDETQVSLVPASLTLAAQPAVVSRGELNVLASAAVLGLAAQTAVVEQQPLDVQAQPAGVVLQAAQAAVQRGELTVEALPAVLALAAQAGVVELQALDVEALAAELQLGASQADVKLGLRVEAQPALLELDARGASVIVEGEGTVIDALPASFGFSARAPRIKINRVEATGPSLGAPGLYEEVVAALEWRRGWHDKSKKKKKKRK